MKINSIYCTFQGEANAYGIGAPVIFLRTAGCHIRCYQATMGILCDTPEALSIDSGEEMTIPTIINKLNEISDEAGGIDLICLSGGDPLWRNQGELMELFEALEEEGYYVSVETSGTLSPEKFLHFENVSFVLDWKLASAGVKGNIVHKIAGLLREDDYVKFVVADEHDYYQMVTAIREYLWTSDCQIVAGIFYGPQGELDTFQLFEKLKKDRLLGRVDINMQTHKLAFPDFDKLQPKLI